LLFQLAVLFIPLMLELVILQTSPFWTSILALLINKERVERFEYIAMAIGFLGVVGITLSKPSSSSSTYSESTRLTGILIAFTLSWVYSATCVFNRRLKDVNFAVVLFYHSIFGMSAATLLIISEKLITGNPFRIYTLQ
jgi:drug/metabolite transporter (DMT)-like permease